MTDNKTIYQVDAFTDRPFKGNPAGVMIVNKETPACFAPRSGINEDPVTGSAHCALTPLWNKKTGKREMNSYQVSARTGRLKLRLVDDRVEISGQAVTIFKAELQI